VLVRSPRPRLLRCLIGTYAITAIVGCQEAPPEAGTPVRPVSSCSDTPVPTKAPGGVFLIKPPSPTVDIVGIENVEGALRDGYCFATMDAIRAHDERSQRIAARVQDARAAVERSRTGRAGVVADAGPPPLSDANKYYMLGMAVRGQPPTTGDTDEAGATVDRFLKQRSIGESGTDFERLAFTSPDMDMIPVGSREIIAPERWTRLRSSIGHGSGPLQGIASLHETNGATPPRLCGTSASTSSTGRTRSGTTIMSWNTTRS
jgi:hypothetical protein